MGKGGIMPDITVSVRLEKGVQLQGKQRKCGNDQCSEIISPHKGLYSRLHFKLKDSPRIIVSVELCKKCSYKVDERM